MTYQCPHCGDVFSAEVFEPHIQNVARNASREQIVGWLAELEQERRG